MTEKELAKQFAEECNENAKYGIEPTMILDVKEWFTNLSLEKFKQEAEKLNYTIQPLENSYLKPMPLSGKIVFIRKDLTNK